MLAHSNNNVYSFRNRVFDQISRFLEDRRRNSERTAISYEGDIREFFKIMANKDLEHVNEGDLEYSLDDIEDYVSYLLDEKGVSASTVNRSLSAIKRLYDRLYARDLISDIRFIERATRPKQDDNSYDWFTKEEIDEIIEYVKTTGRKKTGMIKSVLIKFSADTCSRLAEALNLKWDDIYEKNNKIYTKILAKGRKYMIKEISKEIYKDLLSIRDSDDIYVFNIGEATVNRMMADIREHLGINSNNRVIVFHSIRKTGAQWLYERFGDIYLVSQALGHKSVKTTELYINRGKNDSVLGMYSSETGVGEQLYRDVSHSDLIEAIDKLTPEKRMLLNISLGEIIKK